MTNPTLKNLHHVDLGRSPTSQTQQLPRGYTSTKYTKDYPHCTYLWETKVAEKLEKEKTLRATLIVVQLACEAKPR